MMIIAVTLSIAFLVTLITLRYIDLKQQTARSLARETQKILHRDQHIKLKNSLAVLCRANLKYQAATDSALALMADEVEGLDMNIDWLFADVEALRGVNHQQDLMFQCLDQGLKFNQIDQLATKVVDVEIVDEKEE